jgi:peroxiredoxin
MHAYRDQYAQLFHDGRNVVLIAISVDPADTLAAWARDDEFPFLFASDTGGAIGKAYGAFNPKYGLNARNLFVVAPDGKIGYRMAPFREIDPQSYKELGVAIDRVTPKENRAVEGGRGR